MQGPPPARDSSWKVNPSRIWQYASCPGHPFCCTRLETRLKKTMSACRFSTECLWGSEKRSVHAERRPSPCSHMRGNRNFHWAGHRLVYLAWCRVWYLSRYRSMPCKDPQFPRSSGTSGPEMSTRTEGIRGPRRYAYLIPSWIPGGNTGMIRKSRSSGRRDHCLRGSCHVHGFCHIHRRERRPDGAVSSAGQVRDQIGDLRVLHQTPLR